MTMIEGIGDEVVQFMVVVLIVVIASVAWWSTNARPNRYRTVLVMRSRTHHPVTVSIRTRPNTTAPTNNPQESTIDSTQAVSNLRDDTNAEVATNPTTPPLEPENPRNNGVIPLQEMDSIVDADMAMLDNNRLHFYRRIDAAAPQTTEAIVAETTDEPEPASNDQIREMDSIVSAMEADVTDGCEFFGRPNAEANSISKTADANSNGNDKPDGERSNLPIEAGGTSTDITSNADARKILIKLKYLNETLKEVEGSLDELLKDFKRRHFSAELSSERRVRLIFNGRVLDEAATLRALGLHHRAVVHCLVHPNRPADPQQQNPTDATAPADFAREIPQDRWMDLENLLMTLVSVALTVIWFFRCEYSNMFTASASVALFALTVFYSVAIFGLYLSDTFHFDRRPNQPVPNN